MSGLLYPAYLKFYNALSNLERFDKEADFFNNISCIDNFFSEYRNITFALQFQLKHTDYFTIYEKNCKKYLTDHWFVEKRNETTKQQPFQLIKEIVITTYLPYQGFQVGKAVFSIENDNLLDSLYEEIKNEFLKYKVPEVFFSVAYSFHEKGSDIDLLNKLLSGISSMRQFMETMDREVGDDSQLCKQIKEKINQFNFLKVPRDFLLINDYVFYSDSQSFEKGGRFALTIDVNNDRLMSHRPITELTDAKYFNYDNTAFGTFTFMHASLRFLQPGIDIMPAIMVVYEDGTYDMDVFHADIKTTIYRKFNETAQLIKENSVKEVFFMGLYAVISPNAASLSISKERLKVATADILVCASLDNQLNEKEYVFDGKAMEKPAYVAHVMKNEMSNFLNVCRANFYPIWKAFKDKR